MNVPYPSDTAVNVDPPLLPAVLAVVIAALIVGLIMASNEALTLRDKILAYFDKQEKPKGDIKW